MAFVYGPRGAGTVGDYDSLEGFAMGARPRGVPTPATRLNGNGASVGAAIAAARARGPNRTGTAVTLTAPQLRPIGGDAGVRVLVAAPTSPVIRRAFRTMGNDERATVIRGIARSTGLAGYELEEFSDDDLAGLSLKSLKHAVSNVGKAIGKGVKDTGHAVGNAVTSKIGQAVIGTGLALTGVGLPAAAAIGAAAQAGGGLIKSGGGLKAATRGAVVGGAEGAAASLAGSAIRKFAPSVTNKARDVANAILPGNPFSRVATSTAAATGSPIADAAAVAAGAAALPILPDVSSLPVELTPGGTTLTTTSQTTRMPRGGVATRADTAQRVATGTLGAGAAANKQAKATARKIDAANRKLADLNRRLAAAKSAGDALGVQSISNAIGEAQSVIAQASGAASTGADAIRTAGNAIQDASTGAVAGGGIRAIGDWIKDNKGIAIAGGAAAVGVLALAMSGRGRGASSGGPWTYDARTRGIV